MSTHLKKLAAFVGLQLVLALAVTLLSDPPVKPSPPCVAMETRLREQLRQEFYPLWLGDADYLTKAVQQGWAEPDFSKTIRLYQFGEDGYLAAINDKDWLLRHAPQRRIITLGGSSAAFGVDGRVLAERYGMTPINLGLHAVLRSNYQLRHTQAYVREGDVVLLAFEYQTLLEPVPQSYPPLRREFLKAMPAMRQFFADDPNARDEVGWKGYGDRLALAELAAGTRGNVDRFCDRVARLPWEWSAHGWQSKAALRQQYDAEFDQAFPHFLELFQGRLAGHGMYQRSGFNQYGDYVGHYGHTPPLPPQPSGLRQFTAYEQGNLERNIQVLNRFCADYRAKGAQVLLVYTPLCEVNEEFARKYDEVMAANIDAPILFPIELAHTRLSEHYDSDAHLNWDGICHRMEIMTTYLDRHLTPQVALTPAEHIANRRRAVATMIAAKEAPTQVR